MLIVVLQYRVHKLDNVDGTVLTSTWQCDVNMTVWRQQDSCDVNRTVWRQQNSFVINKTVVTSTGQLWREHDSCACGLLISSLPVSYIMVTRASHDQSLSTRASHEQSLSTRVGIRLELSCTRRPFLPATLQIFYSTRRCRYSVSRTKECSRPCLYHPSPPASGPPVPVWSI